MGKGGEVINRMRVEGENESNQVGVLVEVLEEVADLEFVVGECLIAVDKAGFFQAVEAGRLVGGGLNDW